MKSGELSFDFPSSLSVTWTIPHFYTLSTESSYSLQSPDFPFADGRYCLRLFATQDNGNINIELLSFTDFDPGRVVLHEVQLKSGTAEKDMRRHIWNNKVVFLFDRSEFEGQRDLYVPCGTLTFLCSVRPRKPSGAGNPKSYRVQTRVITQNTMSSGEMSSESTPSLYVTWTIPRFLKMSRKPGNALVSPEFHFYGRRYRLRFVQFSAVSNIHLVNLSDTVPGRYVSYEFGLKSTAGEEIYIDRDRTSTTQCFSIFRDELDLKQSDCFPDGHLTVFCCMVLREPSSEGSPKSGGAETPGSKDPVPQAAARTKSVEVQTSNEEGDEEGLPGVENVLSDYKRLLLKGIESDACLVVCGKEFRAHRNVLRVRSPVFEAMFSHETAEKDSGRVVIDDLKPDRFQDFMEYLYTGRVESFCDENAFGLYAAADKYDVPTLKSECVEYMRRSLSVDNFCDVLTLALRHHEKDLLSLAVEFFKKNVAGIILTVKWQQFMSENSTRANELLIKLHVPGKEAENVLLP